MRTIAKTFVAAVSLLCGVNSAVAADFFSALPPHPRGAFADAVRPYVAVANVIYTTGIDLLEADADGPSVDICAYDTWHERSLCTYDRDLEGFDWASVPAHSWYWQTLHGNQTIMVPEVAWVKIEYGSCRGNFTSTHETTRFTNTETGDTDVIEVITCSPLLEVAQK